MIDEAFKALRVLQFQGDHRLCHFCRGQDPVVWSKNIWGEGPGGRHNGHKPNCRLKWLLDEYEEMRDIL